MSAKHKVTISMRRKMLFFERLMYIDGKTPVNCLMIARLRGLIAVANLKRALEKVKNRHPLLRSNVLEDEQHPSFIFQEESAEIPLRVIPRWSEDDWRAEMLNEWKIPFCLKRDPPVRLAWIRGDETSELVLTGHHCACDGASLVTIFREMLKAMDQPDVDLPPYAPFASLADLVPSVTNPGWKSRVKTAAKAALFRGFISTIRKVRQGSSGEHYCLYWRAGAEMSAALSARCKVEGTTPFAALCVAFLDGFRLVLGDEFKNKLMCPVNIRRFIRNLGADVMFNYAPTIPLSLSRRSSKNFWTEARRMRESIVAKVDRLEAVEQLMTAERLHSSVSGFISLLLRSRCSYDFAFSNVGRLDIQDCYKDFRVETFLGVTAALPWRNATTLVTTQFRGETDLAFVSSQKFLPLDQAEAILNKAIQTLVTALGGDSVPPQFMAIA